MKLSINPYFHHDGIPTFRDSEIAECYDQMESDGTLESVLYDGRIRHRNDFVKYMTSPAVQFFMGTIDGNRAGFGWLSNIEPKMARVHFCIFSPFWGKFIHEIMNSMGRKVLEIFNLDILIGIIPERNIKAINYISRCNCTDLGKLPFGCIDKEGNSLSARIFYFVR
jgi:hypothetical protein